MLQSEQYKMNIEIKMLECSTALWESLSHLNNDPYQEQALF